MSLVLLSGLPRALRYRYAWQLRSSSPVAYPVSALGVHTFIDASVKHTRPCRCPSVPISSSCYPQLHLLLVPSALTGPFLPAGRCPRPGELSPALSFSSARCWSSHRIPAQPIFFPKQLERKRKIVVFIPYISAGDPDLSATAQGLKVLDTCGSDIIELDIPHSDPLANEPAAATQSLARGSNFDAITSMLKVVLLLSSPVALFSNFNPFLKLCVEKLMSILNDAGVRGRRPPSVYDVFISYKQKDMQPQVSHLKTALELREIRTFVDFTVEEGVEFQPAIDKAIEQSEIAVVIVSRNFHSSPWCLKELVKILECRKKWGCIVLPIFWGMDAKELQEQPRHFVDKIDQAAKDFKQEKPRQVKRWRDALRALGRIKGWSVSSSSDKTEADVIKDLADKISAKLNR